MTTTIKLTPSPRLPAPTDPAFGELATTLRLTVSDPPTVGDQLAVYRLAQGIPQTDLAAAAGVHRRATISDIEHGRGDGANPTLTTLRALSRALGQALVILPEASS